jgi:2,3-bisphosphoglycerate-dependent phosphoglycerate mutase
MQPVATERLAKDSTVCYNSRHYKGSSMTRLYLVRHACTHMTGDTAEHWPLSKEGQREANALARQDFWQQIDRLFSSPEPKALQTTEPTTRRWGIPLETVDCLHELRRPRLVSDYQKLIEQFFAAPQKSVAGMKPAAQVAERITRCIKELVAAHPGQTLAVVSHGLVLTLFLAQLEDRWPTVAEWRAVPFAGSIIVDTNTWHPIENWFSISENP